MSDTSRTWRADAAIVATLLTCIAGSAQAAFMPPGATLIPAPSEPDPVTATLVISQTVPVSALSFTGSLTSTVWTNDATNPFGPSAYTFTYQFTNTDSDGSPTSIHRITVSEYDSFLTDASFRPIGVPVSFINRDLSGDVVGFSFESFGGGPINPGQTSSVMVVQTNAQVFANSLAAVIDGSTAMVPAYAPVAIPEPAGFALMSLAGVAVAWRRR
jgi:hypothetical protein